MSTNSQLLENTIARHDFEQFLYLNQDERDNIAKEVVKQISFFDEILSVFV